MVKKRSITAEDLYTFELITDVQVSPDGMNVIYVLQRVDKATEKKYANLWFVPVTGSPPRQFTFGNHVDTMPRWSPDSKSIAFISTRGDERQSQIYVIPFGGGEARPLTDMKGEFASYHWTPDGKRLILLFRKKDSEAIDREKDEKKKKLGIVERHIEDIFFKFDGYGFLPKEKFHIWSVDAKSGKGKQLTDGEYHETFPTISPDGKTITFISNRSENPDMDPDADDLYILPIEGGEFTKLTTKPGGKMHPSFSPDGKTIAYFGKDGKDNWWKNTNLWVKSVKSKSAGKNITGKYDTNIGTSTINDLIGALNQEKPKWSIDGKRIYYQTDQNGKNQLRSVSKDGSDMQMIIDNSGVVGNYHVDEKLNKIIYYSGAMDDPGQVKVLNLKTGKEHTRTKINRRILNRIDLGELEEVWFKGGNDNDLQGWILKPPDFDPKKKYPSILEIHGGPQVQYGHYFMHEFYYLASQGYVVYFCNPRGGQGYGENHAKAIWGDWGNADFADIMKWSDYVAELPYIDPDRMGVTGGSYGGYMTLWIIGHTKRYKAAVAQRVVSNFVSFVGSSDVNWVFQKVIGDKPIWENLDKSWKHSPMAHIHNATTPTLLIHSEQDHRCPIEQGEQAYVALKQLGVESEFVRFPDEPHGLSRMGRTDRRIARLNHIIRWFDKYLK